MQRHLLTILLSLVFCTNIFSQPLEISKMDKSNLSSVFVEFNNKLSFKNLSLKNDTLVIPSYKSGNNEYFYFSFLDRNLKNEIIKEIKSENKKYSSNETRIEYKINKFFIPNNPKTAKAFVSVIFNNKAEVNCTILNGKYGLWVAWPSKKEKDKWTKLFYVNDKELREKIEKEIIEKYKQKTTGEKTNG